MDIKKNQILYTPNKKSILYDLFYMPSSNPQSVVIFCHGYKGFKDWGAWDLVAQEFAKAGFVFLKFNFSHNGGTLENPIDFPDLNAFAENNFTLELDDLDRVISMLFSSNEILPKVDLNTLSVIGHSRGGGIVLIKAEEDPRIKKVVTWAGVSDFKVRFQEDSKAFALWMKNGVTYVENGRTKQQMPHHIQFYTNFKEHEERLTIGRAVKDLNKPQLIIHGDADPTVPIEEAQQLHAWNTSSHLRILEGADHVFGASHPWNNDMLPDELQKTSLLTINFLRNKNGMD